MRRNRAFSSSSILFSSPLSGTIRSDLAPVLNCSGFPGERQQRRIFLAHLHGDRAVASLSDVRSEPRE
jgi:hypothetical protein